MKPAKDAKYLQWIRCHPCCVSGDPYNVVAHHVTVGALRGISQKPTDYWAIPLNSFLHSKLHHMGEAAFWRSAQMDPHEIVVRLIEQRAQMMGMSDALFNYTMEIKTPKSTLEWARKYDEFMTT